MQGPVNTLHFDFSDFAAVAIGYTLSTPALDHVAVDYCSMMKQIIARLIRSGTFRRIGFITPAITSSRVQHLSLGAFLAERHLFPRSMLAPLVMKADRQKETLFEWMREKKPDVIIIPTHDTLVLVRSWLAEVSIRVPEDVSMVCGDCHQQTDESGIVQDIATEAAAVVELVTNRVEHGVFGLPANPQTVLVGGHWRDGKSLALPAI